MNDKIERLIKLAASQPITTETDGLLNDLAYELIRQGYGDASKMDEMHFAYKIASTFVGIKKEDWTWVNQPVYQPSLQCPMSSRMHLLDGWKFAITWRGKVEDIHQFQIALINASGTVVGHITNITDKITSFADMAEWLRKSLTEHHYDPYVFTPENYERRQRREALITEILHWLMCATYHPDEEI